MFIVHVVCQFDPAVGGIEAVVHELTAAQVGAGHRVRVVTLNRLFKAGHNNTLPRARADQWRGFGAQFPDNLNGTDFTPYYLQHSRHRLRIYLLGGKRGVVERAATLITETCPWHEVVGSHEGYFPHSEDGLVASTISASGAEVLLVAMGNPDQELWLRTNFDVTGCRLGFAVGALFDFIAGEVQRAPVWVRTARLEWVYRLAQEPGRLWRRYVLGNPMFMLRILGQWWTGARV